PSRTQRRSKPLTHAIPQASLTVKCRHQSSLRAALAQALDTTVELAAGRLVAGTPQEVPVAYFAAAVAGQQSVRFAAPPYIAAAPISKLRDGPPHRLDPRPQRFLRSLSFVPFFSPFLV